MKRFAKITFLIVTTIFFNNSQLIAQCTPSNSLPTWGIFPDSMAVAHVNTPYQQVMQFKSSTDTVVNISPFGNVHVTIDSLRISSVIGLPSGFTYQCNKPSCSVIGGETGCVLITGTPTQAGNYPLTVNILTNGRANILGSMVAQSQTNPNNHYFILVKGTSGVFEIVNDEAPLKVYPNPAHGKLMVETKSFSGEKVTAKIFDISGKLVSSENIITQSQSSTDISKLNVGIYFIEVTDESKVYRAKFVVE